MERHRLEQLKFNLDIEKDRNVELTHRIRTQNKTVNNMQIEQDIMKRKNTKNEEKMSNIMYVLMSVINHIIIKLI